MVLESLEKERLRLERKGQHLTLDQVYDQQFDKEAQAEHLEQSGQPLDSPSLTSYKKLKGEAADSLLQRGLAKTKKEAVEMVEAEWGK